MSIFNDETILAMLEKMDELFQLPDIKDMLVTSAVSDILDCTTDTGRHLIVPTKVWIEHRDLFAGIPFVIDNESRVAAKMIADDMARRIQQEIYKSALFGNAEAEDAN